MRAIYGLLFSVALLPALAAASDAERDYAEEVVSAVYYEGIPHDVAASISEAGAERLREMLGEAEERDHASNILMCLGISGHPGSFEALIAFLTALHDGDIDRADFRGWRVVPVALGHLARKDPRALRWLIAQLDDPTQEDWSFRRHDLRRLRRQAAILGLGVSGLPEAAVALGDYAQRELARAALQSGVISSTVDREIAVALELNAQVASAGPASIGAERAGQ